MIQTTPTMFLSIALSTLISRCFRYSQVADRYQPGIEDAPELNSTVERPDYGAYNEAFIIHHWASFGPRY